MPTTPVSGFSNNISNINNINNNATTMCTIQYSIEDQLAMHAKAGPVHQQPIADASSLGVFSPISSPEPMPGMNGNGNGNGDNGSTPPKTRDGRIPRPLNSFMTYRRDKHAEVMRQQGNRCNNKFISKIIADMWKEEPEHIKEYYKKKASMGLEEHKKLYPEYKYRPRNRQERLRQRRESEEHRRMAQNGKRVKQTNAYYQKARPHPYAMPNRSAVIPSFDSLVTAAIPNTVPTYMNNFINDGAMNFNPMAVNAATNIASTFNSCPVTHTEQGYMAWPNTSAAANATSLPVLANGSSFMESLFQDDLSTTLPLMELSTAPFSMPTPTPSIASQCGSLASTPVPMAKSDLAAVGGALPPACVQHNVTDAVFNSIPSIAAHEQLVSIANWSPELNANGQLTPPMVPTSMATLNSVLSGNFNYIGNLSDYSQNNSYTSLLLNIGDTNNMN